MTNNSNKKLVIIVCAIIFIILDIFLFAFFKNKKLKEESFKYFNYLNISDNVNNISKEKYISDSYLISLSSLDNYTGIVDQSNIDEIMRYYMLSITRNASKNFENNESDAGFCLNKNLFENSMIELLNFDFSSMYYYLKNVSFINIYDDKVCFDYSYQDIEDYAKFLGISEISVENEIVNANLYLYSLNSFSEETENKFKNELLKNIKNNTLESFNYYISNYETYDVKIEEKEMKFKEIPDGDYFKYQLISINTK